MILFVAGTGTGVGKTFVASAIVKHFSRTQRVCYLKPVQTGPENEDAIEVFSKNPTSNFIPSLYNFPLPASPDQAWAAAYEAGEIPPVEISTIAVAITECHSQCDILIVEAAGGLLVPLNTRNENWLDLLGSIAMETVLVGSSQLGTLNHTQLSIQALQNRGIKPLLVVLSGERHQPNENSLARMNPNLKISHFPKITPDNLATYGAATAILGSDIGYAQQDRTRLRNHTQDSILQDDQQFVWHPFTQHQNSNAPIAIESARGIYLNLLDGRKVIDGISSWWVNTIGHGRKEIADAIAYQQQKLDHVLFAGATHEPAVTLARSLLEISGQNFGKVFFSDNGSTAVEVAIKIAYQSFQNQGDLGRRTFLALRGSYHGDTFGAMSLGKETGFHAPYNDLFFPCHFISPLTSHRSIYFSGDAEDKVRHIEEIEELFARKGHEFCALVLEPLLQGAGGMMIQDETWTRQICEAARRHHIPVIFDEVFTGLGRLGSYFAFERLGFKPDIICIAKGLTGGNLPLAATLATDTLFSQFLSHNKQKAFLHGHSFTANPIACAAANATLAILRNDQVLANARMIEKIFNNWIVENHDKLGLKNPRAIGGVLAFECPGSESSSYFSNQGQNIAAKALEQGLLIRPLGNTVYLAPPLIATNQELNSMLEILFKSVQFGKSE